MAEILLEPSSLSKIIPLSFDLNDTNASNAAQLMTKRQFNTADTDAWFEVSLEGFVDTAGSFDITLFNLNDKSVFNHTGKPFTTSPFYYKLDSESDETTNEIRHAGRWIGQIVVTLANGNSATRKFIFDIEGHILDGTVASVTMLDGYNVLMTQIQNSKDLLDQYNIDYAALLADLEATYKSRLFSVEQQLAETLNKSAITMTHMFADNAVRDAYFVANPSELIEQLFIKVGAGYQQRLSGAWQASTAIVAEQLSATNQPITDTGNYFETDNTNAALQELGALNAETQYALNLKAEKQQSEWLAPTLINGWTNLEYAEPSGYYKDPFGIVHVKGIVKGGAVGQPLFILPVGYRPMFLRRYAVIANDAIGHIEVFNSGYVYLWLGSNVWVSLDAITFRAEV